jgi:nitrogen fixation protein FixH
MQLSGKHVLLMLIAFFGIILAVNIDLVLKAQTTFSGEDVHNAYLQGVDFNETLAKRAEQARLGWQAEIKASRTSVKAVNIAISIREPDGSAPVGLALEGRLRHPSDARLDHDLKFRALGPGHFAVTLPNVPKGLWNIEVHSSAASSHPFEADKRLWLP